jgi:hypothetical protein
VLSVPRYGCWTKTNFPCAFVCICVFWWLLAAGGTAFYQETQNIGVSLAQALSVGMPRLFEVSEAKVEFEAALALNPTSADVSGCL